MTSSLLLPLQAALKGLEDMSRTNTHLPPLEPGEIKMETASAEVTSHVSEEELLRRMTQEHAQRMRHRNGDGDASSVANETQSMQDEDTPQDLR